MDIQNLGILVSILKGLPDTAASRAEIAAQTAENAATVAQQHSIGFEDDGTGLILKPLEV